MRPADAMKRFRVPLLNSVSTLATRHRWNQAAEDARPCGLQMMDGQQVAATDVFGKVMIRLSQARGREGLIGAEFKTSDFVCPSFDGRPT
jgi:hypothetical protein